MHTLSRRQLLGALSTSLLALANAEKSTKNFDVLDYVDPLIGTANGGMLLLSRHRKHESIHNANNRRTRLPGSYLALWYDNLYRTYKKY